MKPQHWDTAPLTYKQKLRDWLGDMAFNEFLSHMRPDVSLDLISDWWNWSVRESSKGLQHIFKELAQMVRDYDPVYWSDDIVPTVYSAASSLPMHIPIVEQHIADDDLYSPCEFDNNNQPDDDAEEYNFLHITRETPDDYTPESSSSSSQQEEDEFSLQEFSQQEFSLQEEAEEEPTFNLNVTPSPINTHILHKKRFRPSIESRNFYIRPFRRPSMN